MALPPKANKPSGVVIVIAIVAALLGLRPEITAIILEAFSGPVSTASTTEAAKAALEAGNPN